MEKSGVYLSESARDMVERKLIQNRRRQPGVSFPSANNQEHIFILRFNISEQSFRSPEETKAAVRAGLQDLCILFNQIVLGAKKIDIISGDGDMKSVPLSFSNFTSTIGFGLGFFKKLNIPERNRPRHLKDMPSFSELGDAVPYSLLQTDFIIQLGAQDDYVNRWVFQNRTGIMNKSRGIGDIGPGISSQYKLETFNSEDSPDILTVIKPWAKITDIHTGFQRMDGKNLLGFNDGISNPFRLSNNVVWTTRQDEGQKLQDGTYMVFHKIEHDLEIWQKMDEEKQERWIGRSKSTGLLLGTLSKEEDRKLGRDMHSNNENVRRTAIKKWKRLYDQQKDPEIKFFDPIRRQYGGIQLQCPVWSHVRKANPRQADGAAKSLIFRRGYLFVEGGLNGSFDSGLLFICFQRDIENGFEYIKKNFLNNPNFPVPELRANFSYTELRKRQEQERTLENQLSKVNRIRDNSSTYTSTLITGKDGLSGPSELGLYPHGQQPVTVSLGGGYYFIPPIPKKNFSDISEQFFD
jgi:Dyp-type peroxidase family